ncbi:MAG: hypothetical protein ACFB2Y_01170 [Fulvivirga sp.]
MKHTTRSTLEKLTSIILGLLMIIFGANKFLNFIAVEPPAAATAQAFLGNMFSSYLFAAVAVVELLGGIFLFFPRTRFLGFLVLFPIIFNIVAFHIAHDFVGNGIWLLPTAIFFVLTYSLKEKLTLIIK